MRILQRLYRMSAVVVLSACVSLPVWADPHWARGHTMSREAREHMGERIWRDGYREGVRDSDAEYRGHHGWGHGHDRRWEHDRWAGADYRDYRRDGYRRRDGGYYPSEDDRWRIKVEYEGRGLN